MVFEMFELTIFIDMVEHELMCLQWLLQVQASMLSLYQVDESLGRNII